jgi:peptide/nickel transport system permease protein
MINYLVRRIGYMIVTVLAISIASFGIIQLPPGDYLTALQAQLASQGDSIEGPQLQALEQRYGLNDPIHLQYLKWIGGIVLHGDFGQSFEWNRPVAELLADRLPLTIAISVITLLFTWAVAFPIGLYSAVKPYSIGDYTFTTLGFLGLAIPNFLLALILMFVGFEVFDQDLGGLFSPAFADSGWNLGKIIDLISHLWVPVVVLGTAGTAGLVRILRANLLDEMRKPYVVAARARGGYERRLLLKYPLRVALNPFISTVGWVLPALISGEVIVAQVLSLPTTGPMMLQALLSQDMYLAGSVLFIVSVLTVIGTFLSDLLLAWIDPRVRHGHG